MRQAQCGVTSDEALSWAFESETYHNHRDTVDYQSHEESLIVGSGNNRVPEPGAVLCFLLGQQHEGILQESVWRQHEPRLVNQGLRFVLEL